MIWVSYWVFSSKWRPHECRVVGSSSTDKQISSSSGCGSISVQTLSYVPMVALCHHDCCELLDVSDSRFSNRFLKEEAKGKISRGTCHQWDQGKNLGKLFLLRKKSCTHFWGRKRPSISTTTILQCFAIQLVCAEMAPYYTSKSGDDVLTHQTSICPVGRYQLLIILTKLLRHINTKPTDDSEPLDIISSMRNSKILSECTSVLMKLNTFGLPAAA